MVITGKTGADAIANFLRGVCRVLVKYQTKLLLVATAAEVAGAITADQRDAIVNLVNSASAACDAFTALAKYSSVN